MRVLLFLVASLAFGSQSIVLSNSSRVVSSNTLSGPWAILTSYEFEANVWNYVAQPGVVVGVWEAESNMQVVINASNFLVCVGPSQITSVGLDLGSTTSFRVRCRRDTANALYTIELWDQVTGVYTVNQATDTAPGTHYDISASRISIGSFFEANGITANVGMVRMSTSAGTLGGTIPPWLKTSSFSNLLDCELEGNLTDNSPVGMTLGVAAGSVSYVATTNLAPGVSLSSVPTKARAAFASSLPIIGFANNDNTALTFSILQVAGPQAAAFTARATATPVFTPPVFGQYDLASTVTDAASLSTSTSIIIGAVATDSNGVVIVPDANLNRILGPLMLNNSWSWYDNRAEAAALVQINLQTGTAPATISPWIADWNVASSHGTISVTYASKTVTGSGTQFQTDFCGGMGNTTPVASTSQIVIWYPSADYPGETSRAFYLVTSCTSQTSLELDKGYAHSLGTNQSPLNYTVRDPFAGGWWTFNSTPGNYYDNVLAFYALYYRTGLTKYRDAARTLAQNFWEGPFYSRGKNYDGADPAIGGNFIAAGPSRGQAPVGLVLWALESGANIWPGIRYLWTYEIFIAYGAAAATTPPFNVQIGDVREAGYALAEVALCAQYDPDASWRAQCLVALRGSIDNVWVPLQVTPTASHGNWRNTNPENGQGSIYAAADGSVFVTVTNGSSAITVTGGTWANVTFQNPNIPVPPDSQYLWFFNDPTNVNVAGNSNAIGDSTYYCGHFVDSTHATLKACKGGGTVNYTGTSGNKGLMFGHITAFGTQPFMEGIWGGQAATFVRDALLFNSDTARAAIVKQFAIDSYNWLVNNGGTDTANHAIWGAAEFLNCVPPTNDTASCGSGIILNGEIMKNFSSVYLLTGDPAVKTAGDEYFGAMFCKPTGGFTCPVAGYGTYLVDLDDGGFLIMVNDPLSNKWFGFFFGYGAGYQWAAARIGGLLPADPLTLTTSGFLRAPAAKIRLTVQAPDGTITVLVCSGTTGTPQGCSWTGDRRQGNFQLKTEYLTSGDVLIGPGSYQTINVQ